VDEESQAAVIQCRIGGYQVRRKYNRATRFHKSASPPRTRSPTRSPRRSPMTAARSSHHGDGQPPHGPHGRRAPGICLLRHGCDAEAGLERELTSVETPDGGPVLVTVLGLGRELEKGGWPTRRQ